MRVKERATGCCLSTRHNVKTRAETERCGEGILIEPSAHRPVHNLNYPMSVDVTKVVVDAGRHRSSGQGFPVWVGWALPCEEQALQWDIQPTLSCFKTLTHSCLITAVSDTSRVAYLNRVFAQTFAKELNVTLKRGPWLMFELPRKNSVELFFPSCRRNQHQEHVAPMLGPNMHLHVPALLFTCQTVCDSAQSNEEVRGFCCQVCGFRDIQSLKDRVANNQKDILRLNTSPIHHSFDFLPPLTPVTTSSPKRKSGYLNPPMLGVCARHAAPSTEDQTYQLIST